MHMRIIPAQAGNTGSILVPYQEDRDHPRASGEHPKRYSMARVRYGSSPRKRGTPIVVVIVLEAFGIIPAQAGNTFSPLLHNL